MKKLIIKNVLVQNPFVEPFLSDILVENGIIKEINSEIHCEDTEIIDGKNKILTPGLIDRHTHGGYGCNFNTCNENELQEYLIKIKRHGVVGVVPTIMTDDIKVINNQIKLLKKIKSKGAKILGIHLEGPFINSLKSGIHPQKNILLPSIENLEKIDTENVKILTYAPELDKDGSFLEELLKRQIIPSIGHSNATYDQASKVFENGVNQITHLFNALPPIHHREPGIVTAALNNDNIYVEIIADLEHIHKSIIEIILKLKPKEKILLVSDSLPISHSNLKETIFGGQKIFYNGNKATSKNGVIAGSTLFLDDIYKKTSDFIKFRDFIGYSSFNIAKSLGIQGYGKIEIGIEYENTTLWNIN